MAAFSIHDLESRLKARAEGSAEVSYTRRLLDRGPAHCAKKLGEEAIETVIAALAEDRHRLIAESADLLYHLLVGLLARFIARRDAEAGPRQRTGERGLPRRAARPPA